MFPVAVAFDSEGTLDNTMNYYEITFSDPFLPVLAVPVQDGHYNISGLQLFFGTAPGVSFQTTVAP